MSCELVRELVPGRAARPLAGAAAAAAEAAAATRLFVFPVTSGVGICGGGGSQASVFRVSEQTRTRMHGTGDRVHREH